MGYPDVRLVPYIAAMRSFTAALVQICARANEPEDNLARVLALVDRAVAADAALIVLPEGYAAFGDAVRTSWAADPDDPDACPALGPLLDRARDGRVVIAGGVPERAPDGRTFNTAFVLADGRVQARYRKVHLFDTDVPGVPRHESTYTAPGDRPVVVDTPLGRIGLSICYDLRFPELYQALAEAGAEMIVVPAAFTLRTGLAHWEPLLRARAIESQAFVLAAAQHGRHDDEGARESYGHSMIVDPWGVVVAQVGNGDDVVLARLDADARTRAQRVLPSLRHRRLPADVVAEVVEVPEVPEVGA